MSQRIDQFCENLRVKLTNIESDFHDLKAKIEAKGQHVEQGVRSHLENVQKRIEQNRGKASASQVEVKEWLEARKTATADRVADWKAKFETRKLQNRADGAERYAEAAIVVAPATVDEAERASLEAWLARHDADSEQAKKA